jgi:hypothetical protein
MGRGGAMSIKWMLPLVLLAAAMVIGGCTTAHVKSEPPGADVKVSYLRGAFGWTDWETRCQTPCTFTSPNEFQLRVRWPDNAMSEIRLAPYRPLGATYDFNFVKSAILPILPSEIGSEPHTIPPREPN